MLMVVGLRVGGVIVFSSLSFLLFDGCLILLLVLVSELLVLLLLMLLKLTTQMQLYFHFIVQQVEELQL